MIGEMLYVGTAVVVIVVGVVMSIILKKRPADDLGSVSAHWIAQNRVSGSER
jgi:hypothetical protein